MKRLLLIITIISLLLNSCIAQRLHDEVKALSDSIYKNQHLYYQSHIDNKMDYISILNFAQNERFEVMKRLRINWKEVSSFKILEGWNHWGSFTGLIWGKDFAYTYKRDGAHKKIKISRVNLVKEKDEVSEIQMHIIDKINKWDLAYIKDLRDQIGIGVMDGYYFIATKVTKRNNSITCETIAFKEYAEK